MIVSKTAADANRYHQSVRVFDSARAALKALLAAQRFNDDDVVLLPAYIGWSPREGSGICDPIVELGLQYAFYRVDASLNIDVGHLEHVLRLRPPKVVVLVHYFGRVDPQAACAVGLARRAGAMVIEDSAHAMLTDLVAGAAGELGDASIFSLHKLLPVSRGGLLVMADLSPMLPPPTPCVVDRSQELPWDFDLRAIARRRRANAQMIGILLRGSADVKPLWADWPGNCVPQTYPVLIKRASRNALYDSLNSGGYGVVSLYHTLVGAIGEADFPESYYLSQHILNLPVHQDVEIDMIAGLVDALKRAVADTIQPA